MKIINTVSEMQKFSNQKRLEIKKISFVPTMGYLHEGHLSLIKKAKLIGEITVVSIFVNPLQFAPTEDLERYPHDIERDKKYLVDNKVDVLFYPAPEEIYSKNFQSYVEVTNISKLFEGASRPNHFRGVTTIVNILFNIVKPHFSIFGQKDAQQAVVIKQMVNDLKLDIELFVEPIIREEDGLALSSRNIYLSIDERKDALVLSKSLNKAAEMIHSGEIVTDKIITQMKDIINSADSSKLDYIVIVGRDSFLPVDNLLESNSYYILIACYIGSTRLIDNLLITL